MPEEIKKTNEKRKLTFTVEIDINSVKVKYVDETTFQYLALKMLGYNNTASGIPIPRPLSLYGIEDKDLQIISYHISPIDETK